MQLSMSLCIRDVKMASVSSSNVRLVLSEELYYKLKLQTQYQQYRKADDVTQKVKNQPYLSGPHKRQVDSVDSEISL